MDRLRTRKPTLKSQPSLPPQPIREAFQPDVEWTEDSSNRNLTVRLPGFKREEIRVQLHAAGKLLLLVKGSRQVADNKYIDVDQSYDVPKDTIIEQISGRFEDGALTLIMPKKVEQQKEAPKKNISEAEGEEPVPDEKPKEHAASEEKRKEPVPDEKPDEKAVSEDKRKEASRDGKPKEQTAAEDTRKEPVEEEKPIEQNADAAGGTRKEPVKEDKPKEKAISEETRKETVPAEKPKVKATSEEMRKEPVPHEKPKGQAITEEKRKEPLPAEKPKTKESKSEETIKEKPESVVDKKDESMHKEQQREIGEAQQEYQNQTEMPKVIEKKQEEGDEKKEESIQKKGISKMIKEETIIKEKSKVREIYGDMPKEIKRIVSKLKDVKDGWMDSGSIDYLREKLDRNRKVIAVAVIAFSAGFYVSRMLKNRGK